MLSYPERAAQIQEHLCTCPSHGYSQYSRWGDGGTETVTLSDGSRVEIATGDRDCSSSVCDAWEHALPGSTGGATYTGNMRRGFTESGCFVWHPWGDGYEPKRGDVYLNETHHTEMYLGGGKMGGFNGSELGTIDGAEGDQTGRESRIKDVYVYSHGWDGILEFVGGDIVTEQDYQAIAEHVWNFEQNGVLCRDRLQGTDEAANEARRQLTRTDDCSDRPDPQRLCLHDHVKWMAAKQRSMGEEQRAQGERLESVEAKLDALLARLG